MGDIHIVIASKNAINLSRSVWPVVLSGCEEMLVL
jgi:hypothetical protein